MAEQNELELPFPHGIEVELQVIRKDGTWLRGDDVLEVFDRLVSSAKSLLDKRIRDTDIKSVRTKYKHSSQTEEGERGSRVVASYEDPGGKVREYTLIGHDPNVTSLTWILEIATPPCTTLEELAWWVQTLVAISYDSIPRESKVILVSTGLNPTQDYLKNLSFGEHHHILGPDTSDGLRIAVYNMFRNFMPHLIALSVNSPFENKAPTDQVYIDENGNVRAPRCKRSIRLTKNTTQMGPTNEFELIPFLETADKELFARHVNRSPPRMVDIYPFTDYGTIELRIFDTQLSVPRRIGLAILLQALALKTKKMLENGERVIDVGAKILAANREAAIEAGLWGPFRPTDTTESDEFGNSYNMQLLDDGTYNKKLRNRFLADAVASMLFFIRDELEELEAIENAFLQPLLLSVFGSEFVKPRTTGADFQLQVYARSDMNMVVLMKELESITRECCTNWLYDPLEGTPNLPTWLCWWKGIEPEIVTETERVFAGQEAQFLISIKNALERSATNLSVSYRVEDSSRHLIEHNVVSIPEVEPGEIFVKSVSFETQKDVSAYNIFVEIIIAGKSIKLSNTINTFWIRATIRPRTTTQFVDGKSPVLYNGEIDTNYPRETRLNAKISVYVPGTEMLLASSESELKVSGSSPLIFDETSFPSLIIPSADTQGVERCLITLNIIDDKNKEVTLGTSRPFYIGYVSQGPQLLLRAPLRTSISPGSILSGEVGIRTRGSSIKEDSLVKVLYVSDSNERIEISAFKLAALLSGSIGFQWTVPDLTVRTTADRTGVIRTELVSNGELITAAESSKFSIERVGVRATIDSLKAPLKANLGGSISGWLRIRRNTEYGGPIHLNLSFVFPDGQEITALKQEIKASRNLSVAYGPLQIPIPSNINQTSVVLRGSLIYQGNTLDIRTKTISLTETPIDEKARIAITGVPKFASPNESLHAAIHISNITKERIRGKLNVHLETPTGNDLVSRIDAVIPVNDSAIYPVDFKIPLSAELSTAHLTATIAINGKIAKNSVRIKIKSIDEPIFSIRVALLRNDGSEVPGLVPRITPVKISAVITPLIANIEDIVLLVRVLSRRDLVKQFETALSFEDNKPIEVSLPWTTPSVDMVTAYYLEAGIEHREKLLPERAVEQIRKQFTVY